MTLLECFSWDLLFASILPQLSPLFTIIDSATRPRYEDAIFVMEEGQKQRRGKGKMNPHPHTAIRRAKLQHTTKSCGGVKPMQCESKVDVSDSVF